MKMKKTITISIIALLIMAGCGGGKQSTDDLITVDVTKSYPKKELILQYLMDVEYIALETTDEFVCQGVVGAVGKDIMLVRNRINDGDLFIFDRKGKGLRKFNRKGQGPREYLSLDRLILDEDVGEIYINEIAYRVQVYDLQGNFLRTIPNDERWGSVLNFNKECLIVRGFKDFISNTQTDNQRFLLISKQDGHIVKEFRINFKQSIPTGITNRAGNAGAAPRTIPIIPYRNNRLITDPSSDTVFQISQDYKMTPFLARTPPILTMNPGIILSPCLFTSRYYFMETVKMEYDLTRDEGFPMTYLAYDKLDNTLFEYEVYNDDFLEKKLFNFSWQVTTNDEIAYMQTLESYQLVEAFKKGLLKGKLKEIAATLDEEDNPVIMIVKHKKI